MYARAQATWSVDSGNVMDIFANSVCNESTISATLNLEFLIQFIEVASIRSMYALVYAMRYTRVAVVANGIQLTVNFKTKKKHVNIKNLQHLKLLNT